MKKKSVAILLIALLVCMLVSLSGCDVGSASLGASASVPKRGEAASTSGSPRDVATESEKAEVLDGGDEVEEAIDVQEEETQSVEEAGAANEEMVWIPKTGNCYHSKSTCSNMKDPAQVPLSDALKQGKRQCTKCY